MIIVTGGADFIGSALVAVQAPSRGKVRNLSPIPLRLPSTGGKCAQMSVGAQCSFAHWTPTLIPGAQNGILPV